MACGNASSKYSSAATDWVSVSGPWPSLGRWWMIVGTVLAGFNVGDTSGRFSGKETLRRWYGSFLRARAMRSRVEQSDSGIE